jgi:hypothetical protein
MAQKYQLENPNNARIFIDYRKDKDQVRFEYVAEDSIFKIAFFLWFKFFFSFGLILIPILPIMLLLSLKVVNQIQASILILITLSLPVWMALWTTRSKRLQLLMPKLQTFGKTKFYARFIPENIQDKEIEIPLFCNVMLDYLATEEFSEYLEKVEIIEHPFNYYIRKKRMRNQYLWKAIFHFSQVPKKGFLNVKFA